MEQPEQKALRRNGRIRQLVVGDGSDQGGGFHPGLVVSFQAGALQVFGQTGGHVVGRIAGRQVAVADAIFGFRHELADNAAGAPLMAGLAVLVAVEHLADCQADARRDLLGAVEIGVGGGFQAFMVQRHETLIALTAMPLFDGHGERALAKQRGRIGGAGLSQRGHRCRLT